MKKTIFLATLVLVTVSLFLSNTGQVNAIKPSDYGLKEGDLISAIFSDDPDVYIINEQGYKRLFLNPKIFNFYGHLGGFLNVKLVTQEVRDSFITSGLLRDCESNDERVYGVDIDGEDTGQLHWINTTGEQAVSDDPNFFKKVFCINQNEFKWYPKGSSLNTIKDVPKYDRMKDVETVSTQKKIEAKTELKDIGQVTICHYPPGNVTGFQTLTVRASALKAHLAHGDTIGSCPVISPFPSTPPNSVLTVLSPNGGEQWALGSNQTIQWIPAGPNKYVDIDILNWTIPCLDINNAGACPMSPSFPIALARKVPNTGSFSWSVGKDLSGSTTSTGFYVVRISNSENSNQYDQSDAAFSIVKGQSGNFPPTISGVSGPSVLKAGEIGKWEVKASDPEQGPLSYLVVWGDETVGTGIAEHAISSAPSAATQTATFTHVYSKAGTYNLTFTVTDNGGLSAKTSVSVSVSGGTTANNPPVISRISPIPSDIKVGQSISFRWGATDADGDNLLWSSVSWGDRTGIAEKCVSPNLQNKQGWIFTASHAWLNPGTYTVRATVDDCRGGIDEHAFNVIVGSAVQPFITVISPNGGEIWTKGIGTTQMIQWQDNTPIPTSPCLPPVPGTACKPAPRYYDITLFQYYPPCTGVLCPKYPYIAPYTIVKNKNINSPYNWLVGEVQNLDGTIGTAPDGLYTIQICQSDSATCDSSDNYFKIGEVALPL